MKPRIVQKMDALRRRLFLFTQRTRQAPPLTREEMLETLEELRTTVEELQVTQEELIQQNEELLHTRRALEVEQQRYQDLFEFSPDGYLVTDLEGVIQEANREAAALLNTPQNFLIGKPLVVFVPEEDRPVFRTQLSHLLSKDRGQDWEVRLRPRVGSPCTVAITMSALRDKDGRPVARRLVLRDITRRKRAEEANQGLAHLGRDLAETHNFAEAIDRVISTTVQLFSVSRSVIFQFDPASGSLTCVAAGGERDSRGWIGRTLPVGTDVEGRVVESGRPIQSSHVHTDAQITLPEWVLDRLREDGCGMVASVPLNVREEVRGALSVYDRAGWEFNEHDLRLLSAIADHAALAFENIGLYGELRALRGDRDFPAADRSD